MFPDPYEYSSKVNLLLVSWSPPGSEKAAEQGEFFHNAAVPDNLRTRIFNGLTRKRADFSLNPKLSRSSLERFYGLGLYLVPTVFRRIKNDALPSDALIDHSSKTHLMTVLSFLARREQLLKAILLGGTPSRAFANLFDQLEAGRKIAEALLKEKAVEEARELTVTDPLRIPMPFKSSLDVWLSNWPRGQGYHLLPSDIMRVLDYSAT